MPISIGSWRVAVLGIGFLALAVADARAQVPGEAAAISGCLCLQQAVAALSSENAAKAQKLADLQRQLADLDAQLAAERPRVETNNPESVARYKALLERRDAAHRQSIGPIHAQASQAAARYNARADEYNRRCAGQPFNPALVAQIQPGLACPPLQ